VSFSKSIKSAEAFYGVAIRKTHQWLEDAMFTEKIRMAWIFRQANVGAFSKNACYGAKKEDALWVKWVHDHYLKRPSIC